MLDADMVPALTVSRSLSRRSCLVDVAGHTPAPLSSYSNTVNAFLQYPDPLGATDQFVEWIRTHGNREHYDLVIPVTERTMVPLSRCRDRLQAVKIAMPAAHSLDVALDKSRTLALAAELGVPGPVGVSLSSLDELVELKKTIKYPVVIKPARSLGSAEGGSSHLQVSYAFQATELQAGCAHVVLQIMVQHRTESALAQQAQVVGVQIMADEGATCPPLTLKRLDDGRVGPTH